MPSLFVVAGRASQGPSNNNNNDELGPAGIIKYGRRGGVGAERERERQLHRAAKIRG